MSPRDHKESGMTDARTRLHDGAPSVRASSATLAEPKRQCEAPTIFVSSDHFDAVIPRDSSTRPSCLVTAVRRDPGAWSRPRGPDSNALGRTQNARCTLAMERRDRETRALGMWAAAIEAFGPGASAALVFRGG